MRHLRRSFVRVALLSALVAGLLGLPTPRVSAAFGPVAYGTSPFQNGNTVGDEGLQRFDMTTGASYGGTQILIVAGPISGAVSGVTAMSKDPTTGLVYVVMKVSAIAGRVLGTIDLDTGEATSIANLGDNFSSITFHTNGQMFGMTGNGATTPETLWSIDKSDGTKTNLATLSNGADGDVICYNPDDDNIYHWSGNGTVVFEKVPSAGPYVPTNIPITGASTTGETFGCVFDPDAGHFLISTISSTLHTLTPAGVLSPSFGSLVDDLRGLVLDVSPVAADDAATVPMNAGPTNIDVLANDTNDSFGPFAVESVTAPANGVAAVENSGANVSYDPNAGFCNDPGTAETFDYTLVGGSSATVSITVPCPDVIRTLTLRYSKRNDRFVGVLGSPSASCPVSNETVHLFRKAPGPDKLVADLVTGTTGKFKKRTRNPGTYYATVDADPQPGVADCLAARSPDRKVRARPPAEPDGGVSIG